MFLGRLLFASFCLFFIGVSHAQTSAVPKYYMQGKPVFKSNGFTFSQPLIGGMNSSQFYPIDINNDGISDIISFDRSDRKLLPFLRSKDSVYTYAPQYETYFPQGFYYYKTADLNSDGKQDIFTLDETSNLMIYRNATNAGDSFPKFDSLGPQYFRNQYVPPFPILYNPFSLSKNDMPNISDYDGDGDLDILTYDAFYTIYVLYKDVRAEMGWPKDTFEFQKMDVCFGYFNDFNFSITLGDCPFKDKLKPRHFGGAACLLFDNDEDGDKEILISNIGQKAIWMLKNGKKEFSHEYDTMIYWDSIFPKNSVRATSYEFPGAYLYDVDGDGVQDLITSPNGFSDVKETNQIWYYKNFGKNNKPDFRFVRDNFIVDNMIDLGAHSSPTFTDIDADGDQDLFVASNGDFGITKGMADRIAFFENTGTVKVPIFELKNSDYLNISALKLSDIIVRFGDLDGDKDVDMVLGDRTGAVAYFKNTEGVGKPSVFILTTSDLVGTNLAPGESNAAPMIWDYDEDGRPDLFVGYYHGSVILYKNTGTKGNPTFTRQSGTAWGMRANEWQLNVNPPSYASFGYAIPELTDLENDGIKEVLIGTSYGTVRLYRPNGKAVSDTLQPDKDWLWQRNLKDSTVPDFGAGATVASADISGDSIPELIFGCSRGGLLMAITPFTKISSVDELSMTKIECKVYPNPASSVLQFQRNDVSETWQITIRTMNGQEMLQTKLAKNQFNQTLSIGSLSSGIYFVEIRSSNNVGYQKLLINRE